MNRRLALLAPAVLTAVALAIPADAAKAVCLQIQDPAGDGGALPEDSLDILSGDIASGKKNLVAALRMKGSAAGPALAGGGTYTLSFTSGGTPHVLTYRTFGTGEKEATLTVGDSMNGSTTAVDFLFDQNTSTVTWIVPRKLIPALKKGPGAKFTGISAATMRGNNFIMPTGGAMRGGTSADSAETARSYTDGTVTCLKGT